MRVAAAGLRFPIRVATPMTRAVATIAAGGRLVDTLRPGGPRAANLCFGGADHRATFVILS
jgi:hypothetical protein